jgi:tetratricopeptide (TPR) repeat protein
MLATAYMRQDKGAEAQHTLSLASTCLEKLEGLKITSESSYSTFGGASNNDNTQDIQATDDCFEDSPNYFAILDNTVYLGSLLKHIGDLSAAEPILQRSLEVMHKIHGPEHQSTLMTAINLGSLYVQKGKFAEAEKVFHKFVLQNRLVYRDHCTNITTLLPLGFFYEQQNRISDAETFYKQALRMFEETLIFVAVWSLDVIPGLGRSFYMQDRLIELHLLYYMVVDIWKDKPGLGGKYLRKIIAGLERLDLESEIYVDTENVAIPVAKRRRIIPESNYFTQSCPDSAAILPQGK